MRDISFDNPYLLLLAIPAVLLVLIPYLIVRNSDNRAPNWTVSLILHLVIIGLVCTAAAGLSRITRLTETTIYVVADVSHSSERNLDELDEKIREISENLPEKSKMGVVCFGKNCVISTPVGRAITSVRDSGVDDSATDIAGALNFTENLFKGDTLKRIVLITDGNDTVNRNVSTLASTVERLTENGVQVDAVFLNNTLKEGEDEVQIHGVEHSATTYLGHANSAKFLIQSARGGQIVLELYSRVKESEADFEKYSQQVLSLEPGLNTATMSLPSHESNTFEYKAVLVTDKDGSAYNNERIFTQQVVGKGKILLLSGSSADAALLKSLYSSDADIDTYIVNKSGTRVPFLLEELVAYDEIVLSNMDVRNVRNANAFLDAVDMVVSQYGKSLITLGDMLIQTNSDDAILAKLSELLPVSYGNTKRDGRLYTIVLDVSNSMFMASKFTAAKQAAVQLISVLDEEDYICFVEFSGDVKVQTPTKVKDCKAKLVNYIQGLITGHGTDIGLGLEEAMKTIKALNLSENRVMVISDGFSFQNKYDANAIAKELRQSGASVSTICTYIPAEGGSGKTTMQNVAKNGGGDFYQVSRPEDVAGVVFGDIAEDFGAVIIEKDVSVTIAKYNDAITKGITSFSNVSGFVISVERYDAVVPLTVTYKKDNGYQETVPLYAYRSHSNGRVASFTGSLYGAWTTHWSTEEKGAFVSNLFLSNMPKERVDHPFAVHLERTDYDAYVEIVPSVLNPAATTVIKIKMPNGRTSTRTLTFDSKKYSYTFDTKQAGTYTIEVTYSYDEEVFTSYTAFEIPYTTEYDEFANFDKVNLLAFMRDNGKIYTFDQVVNLESDANYISTYKQSFAIPLLIAAASLFVIDVFVRKLRIKRRGRKPAAKAPATTKKEENGNHA